MLPTGCAVQERNTSPLWPSPPWPTLAQASADRRQHCLQWPKAIQRLDTLTGMFPAANTAPMDVHSAGRAGGRTPTVLVGRAKGRPWGARPVRPGQQPCHNSRSRKCLCFTMITRSQRLGPTRHQHSNNIIAQVAPGKPQQESELLLEHPQCEPPKRPALGLDDYCSVHCAARPRPALHSACTQAHTVVTLFTCFQGLLHSRRGSLATLQKNATHRPALSQTAAASGHVQTPAPGTRACA